MLLTEELMNTQLYDKVEEYGTLDYTTQSYRQDEYKEKLNSSYKMFFDFETITPGRKHMTHALSMLNL